MEERKQTLEGNVVTISSWRKKYSTTRREVMNRTGKFAVDPRMKRERSWNPVMHAGIGGRYIIQLLYIHSNNIMHLSK